MELPAASMRIPCGFRLHAAELTPRLYQMTRIGRERDAAGADVQSGMTRAVDAGWRSIVSAARRAGRRPSAAVARATISNDGFMGRPSSPVAAAVLRHTAKDAGGGRELMWCIGE
jgi:hypothetical protein